MHPSIRSLAIELAMAIVWIARCIAEPIEVINSGRGGNNTRHLLERIDEVLAETRPALVVIMVGTNDSLNSKAMVPVDEYRNNLLSLVEKFNAAGARSVLMTVPPCHAPYVIARHGSEAFRNESPDQRIAAINATIREIAASEDLPLIDVNHMEDRSSVAMNGCKRLPKEAQ